MFKKASNLDSLMPEIERQWKKEDDNIVEKEVVEALRLLETDGVISLFGGSPHRPQFKLISDSS